MSRLLPGQKVFVRKWHGLVTHCGIYTERNTVISSSPGGGVVEQPLDEFSGGAPVTPAGYPGTLHPLVVIDRARRQIGTPWRLNFNCEHFVNWAHGVEVQSPQLKAAVAFGLVAIVIVGALTLKRA